MSVLTYRKIKLLKFLLFPGKLREYLKLQVNSAYRQHLSMQAGIKQMDVEDLLDWDGLNIKLSRPTTRDGQTSKLEMLILIGLATTLKPGQNFLEIGTFDRNNTLNISININDSSKVITIDLPEDYDKSAVLSYDDYLVHNSNRSEKKYIGQQNVQQIY